jgi:hypothetical protein
VDPKDLLFAFDLPENKIKPTTSKVWPFPLVPFPFPKLFNRVLTKTIFYMLCHLSPTFLPVLPVKLSNVLFLLADFFTFITQKVAIFSFMS